MDSSIRGNYVGGDYLERNPTWHVEDSPWKAGHVVSMLHRHGLLPRTIAEVGCGAGAILRELHDQLASDVSYVGYEISPQAHELCQTRATERLSFKLADFAEDDEPSFDLVLVMDVLEHVEDPFRLLRAVRSRSHQAIFHFPLDISVRKAVSTKQFLAVREDYGHIHYFNKETALAALVDVGYTVEDWFYTPTVDLGGGTDFRSRFGRWHRKAFFRLNQDLAVRVWGGWSLLVLAR